MEARLVWYSLFGCGYPLPGMLLEAHVGVELSLIICSMLSLQTNAKLVQSKHF